MNFKASSSFILILTLLPLLTIQPALARKKKPAQKNAAVQVTETTESASAVSAVPPAETGSEAASPPAAAASASPITDSPAPSAPAVDETEEEDYQVDYEEEPDPDAEPIEPKKGKIKKGADVKSDKNSSSKNLSTMQGSRARKKFTMPAKSETKSMYKKNGVPLDVDAD